jgi:predicted O-methyltransferase YrrM
MIRPIQLSRRRLSEIVWQIIDEKVEMDWSKIQDIVQGQQHLREQADYNTGSLGENDAGDLYKIVKFFQPDVVAEVGTFIGVSTRVIDAALSVHADIYTCDGSNDIRLGLPSHIKQYPKTMSHDMFADLASKEVKVDLVYLDGRLSQQDEEPLNKILAPHTVFVLDDFEGIEKGVANAMMLESPGRVLIYPRHYGGKTAMSIPLSLLQVVAQEAV